MKRNTSPFRSLDEWKSALMTLPDNGFFELLRSVFGNIKTPFSKQRLMDDLCALLSRDEIGKTIAAYIDDADRKIIAAIPLLNDPAPGELESFFAGEYTCAELHALLLNLEERLILYRFRDKGTLRLALNPILEKVLTPFVEDPCLLFSSFAIPSTEAAFPDPAFADTRTIAALFAYLYGKGGEELLKAEEKVLIEALYAGSRKYNLRKKALDDALKVFKGLDVELAVKTLLYLGLFADENCCLLPSPKRIAEFGGLSETDRREYWAAAIYLSLNDVQEGESSFLYQSRLRGVATLVHRFMARIDGNRYYPETTIRRIFDLLGKEDEDTGIPWGVRLFDQRVQLPFKPFLTAMEKAGILQRAETPGHYRKALVTSANIKAKAGGDPVIAMNTAFSLILYPEISFADALQLATYCALAETAASNQGGTSTVNFEISRESAVRGFDQGLSAESMIMHLKRLSGNRLDETLAWTLGDWQNRYTEVSLYQGIVLTLAEDRRYLAETRPLASLIRRTLAPGVYLLSPDSKAELSRVLKKAGVDIIANPPLDANSGKLQALRSSAFGNSVFSSLSSIENPAAKPAAPQAPPDLPPTGKDTASSIKEKFRKVLEKRKLTKPERDELDARIERRLILTEAQLEGASIRYEKLEARGIDYAGKVMIAKQAIETSSFLDISWSIVGGKTRQILALPIALEKKAEESILVLEPKVSQPVAPDDTPGAAHDEGEQPAVLRVPIGKISHLRRIKQSIFGV